MYIEKLTKEDVAEFLANKYSGIETKISDLHRFDHPVAFNVFNGAIVFETEYVSYVLTDYEYAAVDKNRRGTRDRGFVTRFDRDLISYMYERFGEEYKKSFLEYRQTGKRATLQQAAQKYDEETENIEGEFFN